MATYKEWMEITYEQGTRGDMVMDVLQDWKSEREALLSALKNMIAVHRTFRGVPKSKQEWTPIDDYAMSDSEAAIAKAEGL